MRYMTEVKNGLLTQPIGQKNYLEIAPGADWPFQGENAPEHSTSPLGTIWFADRLPLCACCLAAPDGGHAGAGLVCERMAAAGLYNIRYRKMMLEKLAVEGFVN